MTDVSCPGCQEGIKMCQRQPCRPTPEEAFNLMLAGYTNRLMHERWTGVIRPARCGISGDDHCTFLTKDNKCGIQHMKPLEGRAACCKISNITVFEEIQKMWDTDDGRAVVEMWQDDIIAVARSSHGDGRSDAGA